MDFVAVVDQVIVLLRQRGRVAYRTLQRQFQLDDEAIEDLKIELIDSQRLAVDEEGRILVWTAAPPAVASDTRLQAEAERQFHTVLLAVTALLQREQRVTYRTLRDVFGRGRGVPARGAGRAALPPARARGRRPGARLDGGGRTAGACDRPIPYACPGSGAVRGSPTAVAASPYDADPFRPTPSQDGRWFFPSLGQRRDPASGVE